MKRTHDMNHLIAFYAGLHLKQSNYCVKHLAIYQCCQINLGYISCPLMSALWKQNKLCCAPCPNPLSSSHHRQSTTSKTLSGETAWSWGVKALVPYAQTLLAQGQGAALGACSGVCLGGQRLHWQDSPLGSREGLDTELCWLSAGYQSSVHDFNIGTTTQ